MNCATCGRENPPHFPFCQECGQRLHSRIASATPPILDEEVRRSSTAPVRIVAAPAEARAPEVVPVPPPPAPPVRTCDRCRGVVDPGTQFCKYCGTPLGKAPQAPPPAKIDAAPPIPGARRPGTASPESPAIHGYLVAIAKSGADGARYPIGTSLDVGRTEGDVLMAEDPYLSPRHARLSWTDGKVVLWDLGSTNGVYLQLHAARDLSAARRAKASFGRDPRNPPDAGSDEVIVPLRDQDLILVGQQVLRFEVDNERSPGPGPASEHGTLVFGSPATPRYARLAQRTVEGVTRDVYYVRKVETVLGRESGDVVFAEDPFLSRRHAAIRVLGDDSAPANGNSGPANSGSRLAFALVDLGSSNGTFLRIRGATDLVPGDHFRIGQQLFRVDFETSSTVGARNERAG